MTLEEKIRRFDELTAQADELVQQAKLLGDEIKAEQGLIDRNDPISKYLSAIARKAFCLSGNRGILAGHECDDSAGFGFCALYPNMNYAHQACSLKKMNDLLLAFKYSKDENFVPDFFDENQDKYYVMLNQAVNQFYVSVTYTDDINTVYFSNEQAAKECAAWLNELCAKGDL